MELKTRLISLLQQARATEYALATSVDDTEQQRTGTLEDWSIKDLIAHLSAWKARQTERASAISRGETPPEFCEVDRLNAETWDTFRNRTWEEVFADAENSYRMLSNCIERLDEVKLAQADPTDETRFDWAKKPSLWTNIFNNGYLHPLQHISEYYEKHGDLGRAGQLRAQTEQVLGEVRRAGG